MAVFILQCLDKPGGLDLRMATRPAHLDYLATQPAGLIRAAGPLLGADGQPVGSLFILTAEDEAEVRTLADNDPYAKAGLFQSVDIRPWRQTVGDPL